MSGILSVPLHWPAKRCLRENSSRHRKITKNVIFFKKAISVLFSSLNLFTFRALSSICFLHIPWIINSGLILIVTAEVASQHRQIKPCLRIAKTKTKGRFARGMKKISIRWVFPQVLTVKRKDLSLFLSLFLGLLFLPLFIFLLGYVEW